MSPAAHYSMGGIATDLEGRTSLPGLLAAGEVACTGVHGANRLASNSLLEGMVFGARAGRAAAAFGESAGDVAPFGEHLEVAGLDLVGADPVSELRSLIRAAADARTESRGAHQRVDFPGTDPAQAVRRSLRLVPHPAELAPVPALQEAQAC